MKAIWNLVSILFFLSCGQPDDSKTGTSSGEENAQKKDEAINEVTLSVQPGILELSALPDTLDVRMTNHTRDTITTGLHYRVELFENDQWTAITPKDMVFNDIGYSLRPGDSRDFVIRLYNDTIRYRAGNYRVVKYFLAADYAKSRESHEVYGEFKVR